MKKTLQKTLLALTVMVCSLTGVLTPSQALASDSYVPFINYDRIWEYTGVYRWEGSVIHKMKFLGATTIDGKEYHAFGKINTIFKLKKQGTDDYEIISEDFEDNGLKYYVREEEGKLYTLSVEAEYGIRYFYTSKDPLGSEKLPESPESFSECLVYDSDLENGATISLPIVYLNEWYQYQDYRQFYGDTLEIGGQPCRLVGYYWPSSEEKTEYPDLSTTAWIEGLGIITRGCLAAYEVEMMDGMWYDNSEYLTQDSFLTSVYTTEGTVLYGKPPFDPSGITSVSAPELRVNFTEEGVSVQGQGSVNVALTGLDGVTMASATGTDEVSVPTEGLGRGVYVVTAKDSSSTRTLKIKI